MTLLAHLSTKTADHQPARSGLKPSPKSRLQLLQQRTCHDVSYTSDITFRHTNILPCALAQ